MNSSPSLINSEVKGKRPSITNDRVEGNRPKGKRPSSGASGPINKQSRASGPVDQKLIDISLFHSRMNHVGVNGLRQLAKVLN